MFAMPPAIIRDFLAQLGEMLDRVDRDLEQLRRAPRDAGATDRISGALSAIGTGAGFLHLSGLVLATASAASALHNLRGHSPESDAAALEDLAKAIASMRVRQTELGKALNTGASPRPAVVAPPPPAPPEPMLFAAPGVERRPLRLDDSKTPLVEFMVEDLRDAIALVEQAVDRMESPAARPAGASQLARIGLELVRTARFFELDGVHSLAMALQAVGDAAPALADDAIGQILPRLRGVLELLRELTDNLAYSTVVVRPVERICAPLRELAAGSLVEGTRVLPENCSAMGALEADGVIAATGDAAAVESAPAADFMSPEELPLSEGAEHAEAVPALPKAMVAEPEMDAAALASELAAAIVPHELPSAPVAHQDESTASVDAMPATSSQAGAASIDAAVIAAAARVEKCSQTPSMDESAAGTDAGSVVPLAGETIVAASAPEPKRLDAAIAELGNLITQSSRLALIPEEVSPARESTRLATRVAHISDDVTRATSDMKAAVLNARALPISTLFAAAVEAARDGAKEAGRAIEITTSGGEIEIDMGVIDRLRESLTQAAADAGRLAKADGAFSLSAAIDEATTNLELRLGVDLSPGVSLGGAETAELRTTVEAIRGAMVVSASDAGRVEIQLRVPTNLAFVYCTVIRIGNTLAAIPMSGVDAVVKPEADQIVGGQNSRALLVREGAAELLDGHALFGDATENRAPMPYAVVVSHGGKRVALACTRAVGAQEVVVRPMDPMPRRLGPISGVGASSNGSAALIVDVPALVRMADERAGRLGMAA